MMVEVEYKKISKKIGTLNERIKQLENENEELKKQLDQDELVYRNENQRKKIEELEEHLEDVMGCSHKQAIEILELEEKLGLDKLQEEEQNKIVVTISVVSNEVDLDSPIFKRSKMPRVTEFPGGIKKEEES